MFVGNKNVSFVRTSGIVMSNVNTHKEMTSVNNKWVFPPKVPTPNICKYLDKDTFEAVEEKNTLRGLKKQFSGRFKRFAAKKPDTHPTIPPELKPQLKTIYVY
ncbi:uncharacterized protein LOC101454853 [Ceratitis capitata]|uniref:Uncharacterized protein n=1 Tax=Ceratitis capitata TaxID=7213 RepID=W8BQF2_CERCA|nr:uncharacterized protein LOC101454853 [Ceratitis capitata]